MGYGKVDREPVISSTIALETKGKGIAMKTRRNLWAAMIAASVLLGCVTSLHRTSVAATPASVPLANTAEQRIDMITHLKEIVSQLREQNKLLREQNDLLKSGKLKVIVEK
jgi:hypothetical protein